MIQIILRGLAAILVGLGTLLWLWLLVAAIATSSDALGEALAFGYGFTATLFFCIFTLPAGIFVYRGRWLPLALVLAVIPVFVAIGFS
ncbi:hypothetical protein [Microvirga aerophila]|uniref:Uncharacterized protein n=1 Tax=Microvirga aerophila TaxID=670291 RepID=A0A512BYX0_9HYPH|nr:hypothetical protein [Microvirga aerophila]GEO17130.1 hypothetical protein MAE02_48260 [Microvirga aerophila]